jgi:glutamine synthetase
LVIGYKGLTTTPAAEEILKIVKEREIKLVKFVWLGNDLIPRAMATHSDFLEDCMKAGIGITRGMQSFNALDLLVSNGRFGPESSEFRIMPDLDTFACLPYAPKSARFIGELWEPDLKPSNVDARYYLRRIVEEAKKMNFTPMASCEIEFYILRRDGDRVLPYVSEKFGTSHGYDLINDYIQECTDYLFQMGVRLERLKKEYGHSQVEPTLRYTDALKAADDAVTLRDVVKAVAAKHGLFVTMMPRPFPGMAGSGNHLHMSLFDIKGERNVLYDKNDARKCYLSETGYHFVGGLMKHMKAITVFGAPISNSYKRLLPGSWSPAHVSYGYDNRAVAVRIPSLLPPKDGQGERLEYRVPDPSANPYLALGTALAAGLEGIRNKTDPGDPLALDPAKLNDTELDKLGIEYLPRTLGEAIAEAERDPFVKQSLGEPLYEEYIKVRESEWKAYREQVTEWEIANYLTTF